MASFQIDVWSLFSLVNILAILLGTFVGILIGALPGLGAMIAIVLLLPITYNLTPISAVLLLLAAYQGAEYGGSISSITLGIPGTPAAAATVLDGRPLAVRVSPGKALGYSLVASTIGGLAGGLVLIFLSAPLAKFALKLSEPEFFLIGLLGLVAVATLSVKNVTKGMISIVLGLMAGTVGMDVFTGYQRFTFGRIELMDGIGLVPLVVGVFAFSEIFTSIGTDLEKIYVTDRNSLRTSLTLKEISTVWKAMGIGSAIGSAVGIFPGLGAATASWFSYIASRKASKNPQTFGQGNPEGIAAPEAGNNATVGGSLVPLLSLGIPGSPTAAIIMGAFIIHGIQPGPKVFTSRPDLIYGIFYGFVLTTVAMFVVGRLLTPAFARILTIPNSVLMPTVLVLSFIGVYASKGLFFDLWVALFFGIASYLARQLDFSLPSFILAFVLSPIIEESFRRALLISDGDFAVFITRPYSLILLLCILAIFLAPAIRQFITYRHRPTYAGH